VASPGRVACYGPLKGAGGQRHWTRGQREPNPGDGVVDRAAILCVDDEASVLEAVRSQLRARFGARFDIETVTSGAEALEVIEELIEDGIDVPVIISDEIMPEMRGHEFLSLAQKRLPDSRKILMTGQAGTEAVVAAVNAAGLFHYIAKPWASVDLILTVERAVESHAALLDRRRRIHTFHRFVPSGFLRLLDVDDPVDVEAGMAAEAAITVLFTDIQGFSGMSENAQPRDVLLSLNLVFGVLVPIIEARGGIVDKFIGDAVMAIFTNPDEATHAAVELVAAVDKLDTPIGEIQLGVGVHQGRAVLGTVGTSDRIETTAIGDVVNTAARVESMTRVLGSQVLCTRAVAELVDIELRYVGRFLTRGRRSKVGFYQPMAVHPEPLRTQIRGHSADFASVVDRMDDGGPPPRAALDRYLQLVPGDTVARALSAALTNDSPSDS